jgi:carotenoid cleavage dioxygenase-like enzyme
MAGERDKLDRRGFMGAALGTAAGIGAAALVPHSARAQIMGDQPPATTDYRQAQTGPRLYRVEADVRDCEVSGTIPSDLNGAFYRVGPDFQYAPDPRNIPFDGEGHVSMFRFRNGRVDYRSRFVRNERYVAQDEARRVLFPMYRNPLMDDPSVQGLSRGTANTHIINYKNMLLALKEDSPPSALDLLTLETVVPNYTFDGRLPSASFTAHPKIDSETGNMVAFGYQARGHGTDDISVFEFTPGGELVWNAWIKVPYIGLLHDFAVTQRHIVFYVIPMVMDEEQMRAGGIHYSWDRNKPTYFGVMRRDGDGSDLVWIEGPERSATHVMGAFSDGNRVIVDVEMSRYNPFPFMPMKDGSRWDPQMGSSRITRLTADLSRRTPREYGMETLYENYIGALPRQDDRYNTMPYRIGFLPCPDPNPPAGTRGNACYARFDHSTRSATLFNAGPGTSLAECCFAPKNRNAPEGQGYLLGLATRQEEGGRGDLVILDAERLEDGPVATVHLPIRAPGQVHGWWVPESQMPVGPA